MTSSAATYLVLYLVMSQEVLFHATRVKTMVELDKAMESVHESSDESKTAPPKDGPKPLKRVASQKRFIPPEEVKANREGMIHCGQGDLKGSDCIPQDGVFCNPKKTMMEWCTVDKVTTEEKFWENIATIKNPGIIDRAYKPERYWKPAIGALSAMLDIGIGKVKDDVRAIEARGTEAHPWEIPLATNQFDVDLDYIGQALTTGLKREGQEFVQKCGFSETYYQDLLALYAFIAVTNEGLPIDVRVNGVKITEDQEDELLKRISDQFFDPEHRKKHEMHEECKKIYDQADFTVKNGNYPPGAFTYEGDSLLQVHDLRSEVDLAAADFGLSLLAFIGGAFGVIIFLVVCWIIFVPDPVVKPPTAEEMRRRRKVWERVLAPYDPEETRVVGDEFYNPDKYGRELDSRFGRFNSRY